ncbi:MAG: diguanylate cyclase, partial [Methyloprofundus sp.]|nr:diguanylate cyclase [Methyloprofundus sp.]
MEEDLITNLLVLQSHLDVMLDRMQSNNITLRRFQMFEMGLLSLNSLAEMLEYVLNSQDFFEHDYIGFCLIDAKNELKKYLSEDGFDIEAKPRLVIFENNELMRSSFGRSVRPYIGPYNPEKHANYFVVDQHKLASVTVIPLIRKGRLMGALCLGSFDPDRFV